MAMGQTDNYSRLQLCQLTAIVRITNFYIVNFFYLQCTGQSTHSQLNTSLLKTVAGRLKQIQVN